MALSPHRLRHARLGTNRWLPGLEGDTHQRHVQAEQSEDEHVLPRVHRVIGLLKRWLMGTHHGVVSAEHLDDYLNEFTFRFTPRTLAPRGKLFYRLAQQAVHIEPVPFAKLVKHDRLCRVHRANS